MSDEGREIHRLVEEPELQGDLSKAARLLAAVEPVEPASPAARARVFSRLAAPAPRRRGWVLAAAVTVAALLLLSLVPSLLPSGPAQRPSSAKPSPPPMAVAPAPQPESPQPASPGRRVRSGPNDSPSIELGDLAMVELQPNTEIIAFDPEARIELVKGEVSTRPIRAGSRVVVSTLMYAVTAEVVRVARTGDAVEVEAGAGGATVEGPEGRHQLAAGALRVFGEVAVAERSVEENVEPEVPRPRRRAVRRKLRPERRRRRRVSKPAVEAAPEVTPPKREAEVPKEPPEVTPPIPSPIPSREARVPREQTPPIPARETTPPIPATPDWGALYRQATREKSAARAVALFDRVAKSSSQWAEVSAYQAARLTMRRGRCREAVRRFASLLRGTYGLEAHLDTLECQLSLGDLDAAEVVLDATLQRYPDNGRSTELKNLRAELARRRSKATEKK